MKKTKFGCDKIKTLVEKINRTYEDDTGINFIDTEDLPVREKIIEVLDLLSELLFPGYTGARTVTRSNVKFIVGDIICQVHSDLTDQIGRAFHHGCRIDNCDDCDCASKAAQVSCELLGELPKIRQMLKGDVEAAFTGDPAAKSRQEIVISYPGITAIAAYRIAHELYLRQVPLIPRMITECAHARTGIDINPGAKIGKNFFIDHGTGVVIGETTIIGNNVKIYQGVTLGALAPAKGQKLRDIKRHPTIENDVTIYAEATILGDVNIGKASVISGNVWLNESVPENVIVSNSKNELTYKKRKNNGVKS